MLNKRHYDPASLVLLSINVFFLIVYIAVLYLNEPLTLMLAGFSSYIIILFNLIFLAILFLKKLLCRHTPSTIRRKYVSILILNLIIIVSYFFIHVQVRRALHYHLYVRTIRNLSEKLYLYTKETGSLPDHETWCDDLLNWWVMKGKTEFDLLKYFDLETNDSCSTCFAMNENVRYSSPCDVVLLFQSHEGWNGHGGREAMAFDFHHNGKCIVLFNNGIIEGYTEEEAEKLLWE